jgi:hypothetical protein
METIAGGDIKDLNGQTVRLFSGNFFLGNFNEGKMFYPLAATELGFPYPSKPDSIKGFYKYMEGPGYFMDGNGNAEPGRPDSCSINIKFYRSDLPDGRDTILTVENIDESELLIAEAGFPDCVETGNKFKEFKIKLMYKNEPEFGNNRYKLAITFAASKNGDVYAGKIGTKLIVDEVEIIDYEN